MTSQRESMKGRSVTYPISQSSQSAEERTRGKLKRMDCLDLEVNEGRKGRPLTVSSHSSQASHNDRRNLSVEGRIRTKEFHKAHSSSVHRSASPSLRLLRYSDDVIQESILYLGSEYKKTAKSAGYLSSPVQKKSCPLSFSGSEASPSGAQDNQVGGTDRPTGRKCQRSSSMDKKDSSKPTKSASTSFGLSVPEEGEAGVSEDHKSRMSHFRRAISLFALNCDKETDRSTKKEKNTQKRILRPPTRYIYKKGPSGLPILCDERDLGVAY